MAAAVGVMEEDIREKIKVFMGRMDKMEARIKEVEAVTEAVPKLTERLSKVESRVGTSETIVKRQSIEAPPPLKAFIGGASIGLLVLGAIAAAWFLDLF